MALPVFPGNLFTWCGNNGITDCSDIAGWVQQTNHPGISNISNGFYIKSHKTGQSMLFLFQDAEYNEGDIQVLKFASPGEGFTAEIVYD